MVRILLGLFGYIKVPLEAVRLSIWMEDAEERLLRLIEKNEEFQKREGSSPLEFIKQTIKAQKVLTKFLRSGGI